MTKPLLILGAGGHASILVDILLKQNRIILGVVAPSIESQCLKLTKISHFLSDNVVFDFNADEINLVNGIGSLPKSSLRANLYKKFTECGYEFETIIANSSEISDFCEISKGVHILHGAIVQAGTVVGENSIVNTGAQIDHDCRIGSHNHLAPGTILSGGVCTEEFVHFGTKSGAIQNVRIGEYSIIGAGAVVTNDIPPNTICYPSRNTIKELH